MQLRLIRTVLTAALTLSSPVALQAQYNYAPPPPDNYAPPPGYQASPYDQTAPSAYQPAQPAQAYDPARLDQMLAPIALYPDQLLGQILMASTYPAEIQEAAAWLQDPRNASWRGEALAQALAQQDWDPSVKSLMPFPDIIRMLASHPDWMQRLGDAFLADQAGVMDSVQRLRHEAWNNGTLRSTPQQVVAMRGPDIVIEPANPSLVYVPAYNPRVAYGGWAYPDYPPYYFGSAGYGATLVFGAGFEIPTRDWDWDRFDWRQHRLHIDRDRMSWWDRGRPERFRQDRAAGDFWTHNPEHRRGVDYRDQALRERFQRANIAPEQGDRGTRTVTAPSRQFQPQGGTEQQNWRERNAQEQYQYPQNRGAGQQRLQERDAQQQQQRQERNVQQQQRRQERDAQQQQRLQERNAEQQRRQETRPNRTGPTASRESNAPRQEIAPSGRNAQQQEPRVAMPQPRQNAAPQKPQRVERPPAKERENQ
jgi:Protein of unknown function (DUF3300)